MNFATIPPIRSPSPGANELRPRVGFIPTSPQHDAGTLIEPKPSLAYAAGRMRAATADDAPPDEPPGVTASSQGFRLGP